MKTIVLKLGGAVCLRPETLNALTQGLLDLIETGHQPVLVHGGGPQLDAAIQKLGESVVKHKGLRYTSEAAAAVVERELDGIGAELTQALKANGLPAVHLGTSLRLVKARVKRLPDGTDLGRVGTFDGLDAGLIRQATTTCADAGPCIPVLTPVGFDADGPLNVNADEAAAGIAATLGAERLFLATDVPNILGLDKEPVHEVDEAEAAALITDGAADGGMIPKLMSALAALQGGVLDVLVTSPTPDAFEALVAKEPKIGTRIRANPAVRISFGHRTVKVHQVEA